MHILIHNNRNVIPVSLSSFQEIFKFSSFLIPEPQRRRWFYLLLYERNLSALLVVMMTFKYDKKQMF